MTKTKKARTKRFWAILALSLLAVVPAAAQGAKRWKTWVKGPGATWVQGCTYTVDTDVLSFPPSGGTAAVTVTTNGTCAWAVENVPAWVQSSRQGATVTVTVGASATARGADLLVAGRKVRVNQEGTERGLWLLDAAALQCDARGGYTLDGVDVRPNQGNPGLTWAVTVSEPWIQVVGGCTGNAAGEVTLLLEPNKTGMSRSGWIGLCGGWVRLDQTAQ